MSKSRVNDHRRQTLTKLLSLSRGRGTLVASGDERRGGKAVRIPDQTGNFDRGLEPWSSRLGRPVTAVRRWRAASVGRYGAMSLGPSARAHSDDADARNEQPHA